MLFNHFICTSKYTYREGNISFVTGFKILAFERFDLCFPIGSRGEVSTEDETGGRHGSIAYNEIHKEVASEWSPIKFGFHEKVPNTSVVE